MFLGFILFFNKIETPNLLKRIFEDVYGSGYNITEYAEPEYTKTLTATANNVYVHDSVFLYCSSSSNGGALYCSSNVYKLLVEQSFFISCNTSSSLGGGICFISTSNGECVLSKICGFNCTSTRYDTSTVIGLFARIAPKNEIWYKNHVNGRMSLQCISVNLTNNKCYSYRAFQCYDSIVRNATCIL